MILYRKPIKAQKSTKVKTKDSYIENLSAEELDQFETFMLRNPDLHAGSTSSGIFTTTPMIIEAFEDSKAGKKEFLEEVRRGSDVVNTTPTKRAATVPQESLKPDMKAIRAMSNMNNLPSTQSTEPKQVNTANSEVQAQTQPAKTQEEADAEQADYTSYNYDKSYYHKNPGAYSQYKQLIERGDDESVNKAKQLVFGHWSKSKHDTPYSKATHDYPTIKPWTATDMIINSLDEDEPRLPKDYGIMNDYILKAGKYRRGGKLPRKFQTSGKSEALISSGPYAGRTFAQAGSALYDDLHNNPTEEIRNMIFENPEYKKAMFDHVSGLELDPSMTKVMNGLGYVNNAVEAAGQLPLDVANMAITPTYKVISDAARGTTPFDDTYGALTEKQNNRTIDDAIGTAGEAGLNGVVGLLSLVTGGGAKAVNYVDDAARIASRKGYISNLENQIVKNEMRSAPYKSELRSMTTKPTIQRDKGLTEFITKNRTAGDPFSSKYTTDSFYNNPGIYRSQAEKYMRSTGKAPAGYEALEAWYTKRSSLLAGIEKYSSRVATSKQRIGKSAGDIKRLTKQIDELLEMSGRQYPGGLSQKLSTIITQGGPGAAGAQKVLEKLIGD